MYLIICFRKLMLGNIFASIILPSGLGLSAI